MDHNYNFILYHSYYYHIIIVNWYQIVYQLLSWANYQILDDSTWATLIGQSAQGKRVEVQTVSYLPPCNLYMLASKRDPRTSARPLVDSVKWASARRHTWPPVRKLVIRKAPAIMCALRPTPRHICTHLLLERHRTIKRRICRKGIQCKCTLCKTRRGGKKPYAAESCKQGDKLPDLGYAYIIDLGL